MSLISRVTQVFRAKKAIKAPTKPGELNDYQQSVGNAKIAADGAKMYNAAHPGKSYVQGKNGETYKGGVDTETYQQQMATPGQSGNASAAEKYAKRAKLKTYTAASTRISTKP